MKNKIIILLTVFVISLNFIFMPTKQVHAEGFTETGKTKLTQIIRGIGEKIGVKWTVASLGAVVSSALATDLSFWMTWAGQKDSVPVDADTSQYLLTPDDFKKGTELIKDSPIKTGDTVNFYDMCTPTSIQNVVIPSGFSYILIQSMTASDTRWLYLWKGTTADIYNHDLSLDYYNLFIPNTSGVTYQIGQYKSISGANFTTTNGIVNSSTKNARFSNYTVIYDSDTFARSCPKVVTAEQVPNISNVNTTIINNTYNYNTVNEYAVNAPVDPNTNIDTPENDEIDFGAEPVEDKPTGGSWWQWLLKPLIDAVKGLGSMITGLFVPSDGFFQGVFDGIFTDFQNKFSFSSDLSNFFNGIKSASTVATIPTFEVTMPSDWGGGTFNIIDFKYFTDYRNWVLNFIRFTAWYLFLKRLYNRIPRMIY